MRVILLLLSVSFAQSAKSTGAVAPNHAEFTIPLEQPANATWFWNRPETPDNGGEYIWQVKAANGTRRFSFGFYKYKFPGSKPAQGVLQTLLKAGQASVFEEDAEGRGGAIVKNAKVEVSTENDRIVLRITDPNLIRVIFGGRPETVTINTRGLGANFEVVTVEYRN